MRMQRRMLRNQLRMFVAKVIVMLALTITFIVDPISKLGSVALLLLMFMFTIFLAECTEEYGDTSGSKGKP